MCSTGLSSLNCLRDAGGRTEAYLPRGCSHRMGSGPSPELTMKKVSVTIEAGGWSTEEGSGLEQSLGVLRVPVRAQWGGQYVVR